MIDLKHEIERELSLIDPPDLWDRIQADASNDGDGDGAVVELTTARHPRRPSLWLAVASVAVLLALIGAVALLDDHQTIETTPATEPPANGDGPTTLAKAEDVGIGASGQTLNIDVMQQDGKVTGEFRVNNVVVTVECAGTETDGRDLILGGVVTDDPDGERLYAGVGDSDVLVGDPVALIIRERSDGASVVLYGNDSAGSCAELVVESVPFNLDGGFFSGGGVGDNIETGPFSRTLARAEDVEIVLGGGVPQPGTFSRTLNVEAVEEDGEVSGEFRLNNVVVALQCADTDTIDGEIRLGGELTSDPDGRLVALIIREEGPDGDDRVYLYSNDSAGSCAELVESVPFNLDGGFFDRVQDGYDIETGGGNFSP